MTLFDLLRRLQPDWGWELSTAHFDHRMRPGSAADARWVARACREAGVVCHMGRAPRRPRSEADARHLRYEFLEQARDESRGGHLLTGHQADDQAETVLFRLLRGSGMRGIAGIPPRRGPGIVRPLLPFWRAEIEDYAGARELEYRKDPTNRHLGPARNWIRHQLIPGLESTGERELRRDLVRLGGCARRIEAAVHGRVESAAAALILEASQGRIVVARSGFAVYDSPARAHLLRALVARVGPRPGRVGTRLALEFINAGQSGRGIELAGGIAIRREFDRLYIERRSAVGTTPDIELTVPDAESGAGEARIAGVRWRVRWRIGSPAEWDGRSEGVARFDLAELRFPLTVRAWRPGDRIRTRAGTRRLKKLFVDRRVELSHRASYPVVADGESVLWIVGLARGVRALPRDERRAFSLRMEREG